MDIVTVQTWAEAEAKIADMKASHSPDASNLLFRGHASAEWTLQTTLDRASKIGTTVERYYRLSSKFSHQIESYTDIKSEKLDFSALAELFLDYDEFSQMLSFKKLPNFEYFAYLRHHGFPSPLLDWSRSAYVAAHFAFSKPEQYEGDVAIYVYYERDSLFKTRSSRVPEIYLFGPYNKAHKRHFLQQSQYTSCLHFHDNQWWFSSHEAVFDRQHSDQDVLTKIVIPAKERHTVLTKLDEFNLNAFSLFGSEESLMDTLAFREFG